MKGDRVSTTERDFGKEIYVIGEDGEVHLTKTPDTEIVSDGYVGEMSKVKKTTYDDEMKPVETITTYEETRAASRTRRKEPRRVVEVGEGGVSGSGLSFLSEGELGLLMAARKKQMDIFRSTSERQMGLLRSTNEGKMDITMGLGEEDEIVGRRMNGF